MRGYASDYSLKCINDVSKPVQSTIMANCPDRRFKSFGTEEYVFLGKNKDTNSEIFSDYIIKKIKTNEILDGSTATGYEIQLGVFEALCPSFIK